jgi:hypothetical protein
LFTLLTVIRGAGGGLRFDPGAAASQTSGATWLGGVDSTTAEAFVLVLAVTAAFARAVGVFGLLASRVQRRDPLTWLLLGASLAGAIAVGTLSHGFEAQNFFARSGAPLMALGSALGLVVVIDNLGADARRAVPLGIIAGALIALVPLAVLGPLRPGGTRHALGMIAMAVAVLVLIGLLAAAAVSRRPLVIASVLVVAVLAGGVTVVGNSLVQYEPPRQPQTAAVSDRGAVTRDQIDAARWIRDHSDVDDIVMTNRHCIRPVPPRDCDSRRFAVAAFSERQVLIEGWTYTPMAVKLAPNGLDLLTVNYWEPELLALNDGFIAQPTEAAARELRGRGVRWVFVDDSIPHASTLEPFADLRFQTLGVDVYELTAAS